MEQGPLPANHPANFCLFVLVAMEDQGMIVLPTHRVLGGLSGSGDVSGGGAGSFTMEKFKAAAQGKLKITPFAGRDLAALEAALPRSAEALMPLASSARRMGSTRHGHHRHHRGPRSFTRQPSQAIPGMAAIGCGHRPAPDRGVDLPALFLSSRPACDLEVSAHFERI